MMRHFYYTIQTLMHDRGTNIIKIASLTLGIFVGILLFSCVAFQLNYYDFCPKPEQLYIAYMNKPGSPDTYGTLAGAIRENFPKEVEDATVLRDVGIKVFYNGNVRLSESMIYADEHLFAMLGMKILAGKAEELVRPDALFISRSLAKKLAEGNELESVVGKTLSLSRKESMTIRGVFEDMKENSDFLFDIVAPMSKLWNDERAGWGFDISYTSIIRFRNPAEDVKEVEARMPEMLKKYLPVSNNKKPADYSFRPLQEYHTSNSTVRIMVLMMSVLGVAILLIAAFDYVLIAISSLARRAKSIGVHKCSGATDGSIFRMFLTEMALILFISVLLTVILMFQFREFVEDTTAVSLSSLFTWQTLWVPLVVLLVVFILAGVIPAAVFASIPVTQVFHRYAERKTSWKRPLLFIQFAGMSFILGFLIVVFSQYRMAMNKDLGYNPERVVMCWHNMGSDGQSAKSFFKNLPMVEDYGSGEQPIWTGWSGETFYVEEGKGIKSRFEWISADFVPMMGIQILQGKNVATPKNEALVNEEFVRQAQWTDNPIGKQFYILGKKATVVGVVKNFSVQSVYYPQPPVVMKGVGACSNHYLRLKEPFDENLKRLNKLTAEAFPTDDVVFYSLKQKLDSQYTEITRFRNAVGLASVFIFLIALMGLLGYVGDEIRFSRREIAIRKVNGADTFGILKLFSRNILYTAFPAIVVGVSFAWLVGMRWLEQFGETIQLNGWIFVGVGIFVILVILICVILKAWKVANENPVNSIANE